MRKSISPVWMAVVLGVGLAMPLSGWSQAASGHDHTHAATPPAWVDGEVRKVDVDAGKVTIRHGEIRHLDMPPMTMVFTARDQTLLANVKVGAKVRFMAISEGGKIVLTDLQPAP